MLILIFILGNYRRENSLPPKTKNAHTCLVCKILRRKHGQSKIKNLIF